MRRCVYYNRRDWDDFKAMRLNKGSKSETPPCNTENLDIAGIMRGLSPQDSAAAPPHFIKCGGNADAG